MRNPNLRLNDLVSRGRKGREESKLMNVKVPEHVLARIDRVATNLGATKTEVVIAILNEGLDTAESELKGWTPPPKPVVPKERRCTAKGCDRERVAKGLCATHYQAQRRARAA
ncbi:MAG: hypothetical protein U0587_00145 [Candidatus Binatia bacterium]